jgi:hypothetical protein
MQFSIEAVNKTWRVVQPTVPGMNLVLERVSSIETTATATTTTRFSGNANAKRIPKKARCQRYLNLSNLISQEQ